MLRASKTGIYSVHSGWSKLADVAGKYPGLLTIFIISPLPSGEDAGAAPHFKS